MKVGQPVPVVVVKKDQSFELDKSALERIFLQGKVKDKHVVVVSVAGAFRMGKSFLLNFMLRYLKRKGYEGSQDWLGHQDEPLTGFNWCHSSCERVTNGILIWSEPFIVTTPEGDKLAVFLMDTQGVFDSESTENNCATIFALSNLISSVQVFNLTGNIKEDDLQHLQYFTEYGKLCFDRSKEKPFQKLVLVRDWSNFRESKFGIQGRQRFLDKRLGDLTKHLKSSFNNICYFPMSHPGLTVTKNPEFDGRLREIEDLVHILLHPSNLVAKNVNGRKITCRELVQYFTAYVRTFKSSKLPKPKSVFQATAEVNTMIAVERARAFYLEKMEKIVDESPAMSPEKFDETHRRIFNDALNHYYSIKKMRSDEFFELHVEQLEMELSNLKVPFCNRNEHKLKAENYAGIARFGVAAVAAGAIIFIRGLISSKLD